MGNYAYSPCKSHSVKRPLGHVVVGAVTYHVFLAMGWCFMSALKTDIDNISHGVELSAEYVPQWLHILVGLEMARLRPGLVASSQAVEETARGTDRYSHHGCAIG